MGGNALFKLALSLLLLNYSHKVLTQDLGLISKSKWNSPENSNSNANGQSKREIVNGEKLIVAEGISCWEQNGHWAEVQLCPNSTIVTGHRFRYLVRTGLTGIQLKCTKKHGRDETENSVILDMNFDHQVENDLPRGKWGIWKNKSASVFAEGFSFNRDETSLRRSVQNYNVIYHSGNQTTRAKRSTGNSNSGKMYTKCPEDHAICGLTAMMDKAQLGILTAIGLKCCHHCVPMETWKTIHRHDNPSDSKQEQKFETKVGLQRSLKESTDFAEIPHKVLHDEFSARFGKMRNSSNSTEFNWFETFYTVWTAETRINGTYTCEAQRSCGFIQLEGQCGSVRVPVGKFCEVSVPVGSSIPDSCNLTSVSPNSPSPTPTNTIVYIYTYVQNDTHNYTDYHNHKDNQKRTHFQAHPPTFTHSTTPPPTEATPYTITPPTTKIPTTETTPTTTPEPPVTADATCEMNSSICDPNAWCSHINSTFQCHCKHVFNGDGRRCTPQDLCTSNSECSPFAECRYDQRELRHSCRCREEEGYEGDGRNCTPSLFSSLHGGIRVDPSDPIPYQLSIRYETPKDGKWTHICGGVILDEKTAITAAHCFDNSKDKSRYRVVAGENTFNVFEANEQVLHLENLTIHPDYTDYRNGSDIAILHVNKFELNEHARGVWLSPFSTKNLSDLTAVVSGWITVSENSGASTFDFLWKWNATILSPEDCREQLTQEMQKKVQEGLVCAGNPATRSCAGDFDGPLVIQNYKVGDSTGNLLVGIASFGPTNCSGQNSAVAFTEISYFYDWIQENRDAPLITSCSDAVELLRPSRSQKQWIYPHGNETSLEVLCDFETDGGGWTIIQKRTTGPREEFKQNWTEYSNGFGSLDENFWIGLENIHALTQNGDQELRIQLEDFQGEQKYAKYSRFSVSDASDFYRLTIGRFSGGFTLQDSLTAHHNGSRFTTIDKDNDNNSGNCAVGRGSGGWWFREYCGDSNLNGLYFEKAEAVPYLQGIIWRSWRSGFYSLAKSEMKIRTRKS